MTYSAQAGARRVVPLLAVGLGIAVAIMAFAPAAPTSSPGAAVVGIHEANYEVEGEDASPLTWYFKVHTGVKLRDAAEFEWVAAQIAESEYDMLVDSLLHYHEYKIRDQRAVKILEAIRLAPLESDSQHVRLAVGTRWDGESGYWFHVTMKIPFPRPDAPGLARQFIRWLQDGDYNAIQGQLRRWTHGRRPQAIVDQVKRRPSPRH